MESENPAAAHAGQTVAHDNARPMRFRRKSTTARLSDDCAKRQGRVARIAFEMLGRDGATSFLNAHDEGLGGRPLDLAIASADGLAAVELAISARSARSRI